MVEQVTSFQININNKDTIDLENYLPPDEDHETISPKKKVEQTSKKVYAKAKNLFGVGKGSQWDQVNSSVVDDNEDQVVDYGDEQDDEE